MPDDSRELLTVKQVAELLGVTVGHVRWLCLADRLPCDRESGRRNARYLIRRRDVEKLREEKTRAGDGE
jgi:excisionase family DNA binding protein